MRRVMRGLLAGAALLVGGSCVTPSIPLPPPGLEALSFGSPGPGKLVVMGNADPANVGATFYVFDENHQAGAIQGTAPDGSFTTDPFDGEPGDAVQIWYQAKGEISQITTCVVTVGVQLNSTICH